MTRWTQADVDAVAINRAAIAKLVRSGKALVPQASKYGNVKTDSYASKREAKRAAELKLLEAAGEITDLSEQVEYILIPKQDGERACKYIADFRYYRGNPAELVVEDVKGYANAVYRIKRKLMLLVHGLRVRET